MKLTGIATGLALALAPAGLAGCGDSSSVGTEAAAQEIAWRKGDVNDALAEAKESGKRVLLYWGAVWCPPCAQMKVTIFKDPAFIARTRDFVPVYLDGDTEGAQKWGERFGISGYPTVIVLNADGSEVTRLSSATMADELPDLLGLAAGRSRTIDAVLADARAGPGKLSADDWRILAGFAWGNDPKRFEERSSETALLADLAKAAPDPAMRRRFALMSLVRGIERDEDGTPHPTDLQQAALLDALPPLLASRAEVLANREELAYFGGLLVGSVPEEAERDKVRGAMLAAYETIAADEGLPRVDRLATLYGEIEIARLGGKEKVPDALARKVRDRVATVDRQVTDDLERKSLISLAAELLWRAGDAAGAKALLLAEVENSQTPYYYMADLSALAEEDGQPKEAVAWARKAYETAEGPATRVQWAAIYSRTVMDLTPDEKAEVEASAKAVIAELGKGSDGYYQRTARVVARWGKALTAWSEAHDGAAVLKALGPQMAEACQRQGDQAESCGEWARGA